MLQVAEHASGLQDFPDLFIQLALALVNQMMDRKARHHRVEGAESRQRELQIMVNDFRARHRPEPVAQLGQHRRRKIESHAFRMRPFTQHELQQPPVPRAQIEHPAVAARDLLEQRRFTVGPVRDLVGAFQVRRRVFG